MDLLFTLIFLILFCHCLMMLYLILDILDVKKDIVQKAKIEYRKLITNVSNQLKNDRI